MEDKTKSSEQLEAAQRAIMEAKAAARRTVSANAAQGTATQKTDVRQSVQTEQPHVAQVLQQKQKPTSPIQRTATQYAEQKARKMAAEQKAEPQKPQPQQKATQPVQKPQPQQKATQPAQKPQPQQKATQPAQKPQPQKAAQHVQKPTMSAQEQKALLIQKAIQEQHAKQAVTVSMPAQKAAQQPQRTAQQPKQTSQQPQRTAQQPKQTTQQPQRTAQQPKQTAQQPQRTVQLPKQTAQQPQQNPKAETLFNAEHNTEKMQQSTASQKRMRYLQDDDEEQAVNTKKEETVSRRPRRSDEKQPRKEKKSRREKQSRQEKQSHNGDSNPGVVAVKASFPWEKLLLGVAIIMFVVSAFLLGQYYISTGIEKQNLQNVAADVITAQKVDDGTQSADAAILQQYAALAAQNKDMVGWMKIDGTTVNAPVMYTPNDPEYYLKHDFEKQYSQSGMLFMDATCVPDSQSSNMVIYGHNMKNKTMFSEIENYINQTFYEEHPVIRFDSLSERAQYQVFAVFSLDVSIGNENAMQCYYYRSTSDLPKHAYFLDYVRTYASIFDEEKLPKAGDTLITLSTCDNLTPNGRIVVMAKKIQTKVSTTTTTVVAPSSAASSSAPQAESESAAQ